MADLDALREEFDFTFPKFVYVSGALTDMSTEDRERLKAFYEDLGRVCHAYGFKAYLPHVYSDPAMAASLEPQDVDLIDRTAVMLSYLVVLYGGVPSLGPGIEEEMAFHGRKPVIFLCEKDKLDARRISRLARGNPAVVDVIAFTDFADAIRQFRTTLEHFKMALAGSVLPPPLLP